MLLGLTLLAGCTPSDVNRPEDFTHTGCAGDTRAAVSNGGLSGDEPSLLTLKYENGGLRVTRTNAVMNCSIKNGGLICDVSVEDGVISYNVYEKDGSVANCICPVGEMSSLVTGLQEGRKYTLEYRCSGATTFSFTFKKGFHQVIDLTAGL